MQDLPALSVPPKAQKSTPLPTVIFARTSQNSAEPRGEGMLHKLAWVCKLVEAQEVFVKSKNTYKIGFPYC